MNLRTRVAGIALASVLLTATLWAQDRSAENQASASLSAQRVEMAESILAAKERALGEPFDTNVRASLKSRMEALSFEQLRALAQQGERADLPAVLGSVTSDLVYTPVTPCRVFDSRISQGGPGPIPANGQRNVFVAGTLGFPAQGGTLGGCGIPVGATSVIINFVTVLPSGPGNIRAWAVANPQLPAPLAAIINYGMVQGLPAIANGVAVPLCNPAATSCTLGDLRLQADTSGTDILGDVVGYFGPVVGLVTSVNSITGPVTIAAGANISVTPSGSTLTIASTAPINSGKVTSVATGAGLSGGPITNSGTVDLLLNAGGGLSKSLGAGTNELGIADGGVTTAKIAAGAVGAAQINQAQVQTRLGAMCPGGQYLRGVNADGSIVCEGFDLPPVITTVDNPANFVGTHNSIAIGLDGLPVISYYDTTADALKVAKCVNADCSGVSTITTVDDPVTNSVGTYNSIAIGLDGFPVISYFDQTAANLKVAKCLNAACTGGSTITNADTATNSVGWYSSIAISQDGFPIIAYYDSSAQSLKVAKCANAACTGLPTITVVDTTANVGINASIAIGQDGLPVISYQDATAGALKVAKCGNAACSGVGTSTMTVVDDPPVNSVGRHSSLKVGLDGFPVISYFDVTTSAMKVAKCANAACTGVSTITFVDDPPAALVGTATSLAIGQDGFPVISYYQHSHHFLRVAKCVNAACTGTSIVTVVDDDPLGVGGYTSIAVLPDGYPVISYYGDTSILKVAKCRKTTCAR